jgi:hypothetical protein
MALIADDYIEIQMLGARYNHALDFHDHESWADTFVSDGSFISPQGRWDGREALLEFSRGSAAGPLAARHWTNNWVIDGDGDDATSSCYLNLIDAANNGATIVTGMYRDRLRKVDGTWKFVERNVSIDSTD